ncbi:TBC1 domain family member 1 isoform X2 [Labeo rohita]|uniref:TBC1 domain family member 1 isoform X2 n=1 Tax=Labeo rohita TaxID=84645 RepID=A0A498MUU5_LABRO|nr:TBC1 domain family member 1 isoform X2 [Labeo rohita]
MEGICFEVKPRDDPIKADPPCALTQTFPGSEGKRKKEEVEEVVQYRLTLVGSLAIHPQTTMAMLPWVVAEIRRPRLGEKSKNLKFNGAYSPEVRDQSVVLQISANSVCCILDTAGPGKPWDPLQHMVLFDHRPHRITKLIHNSQEPSYFGCLLREEKKAACYVFCCQDQMKVPEIISTLRQAGKSSARQEDTPSSLPSNGQPDASCSTATAADAATVFAKKFEVLFCGRVVVAHKKAPPALIDECIEKFGRVSVTGSLAAGIRRAFSLNQMSNGTNEGADGGGKRPLFFKRDKSFPFLQALDENGLSPELQRRAADGATGVQPTSLQENRTMLFTIGRSQIFLVSPDTKKVAIEKSFREISFCSQGIRHVDHFGFICRESVECGGCQFVCYVFQCANEALVDEIMLTLKQAFSVAALQQNSRTQGQQCDSCPLQQLHKLCDRIEGLHPSKAKLELQKHLADLDNQEQAAVFESTMKARPKSDQEENELIVASLRRLYEERQKTHTHTHNGQTKKGSSKSKSQRENSEGESNSSSSTTLNSTNQETSLEEPLCSFLPSSPLRSHNSTGDLKRLEGSAGGQEGPESPPQGFRRRASTISHSPTLSSSEPSLPPLRPTAATKPKLVRHYSVSTDSPHQSNDVAALSSPGAVCVVGDDSPLRNRRHSWRQQIFLRVATPQKGSDSKASESDLQCRRLKLDYEEITPCLKDVTLVWERMLSTPGRSKHRGEIWKFLSEQYLLRQEVPSTKPPNNDTPYKELLKQLTSQQHAILIDLGRTFPTHPYFSAQLGAGQLSLYNLLKAYSLLDPEVGYCQGLSFVAGVLLLHMSEEDAFHMLKFLMYDMGLRKQYRPDMIILQIQMYQLSRLLHDYHRELYSHLEQYEIGPSLYAAPWFLTAFASHFPLGFVARVFDMLFLQGSEVIFKVALSLLGSHKPLILQHDNLESIVEFIKTTLPNLGLVQMEKTINQVSEMDISKQLQAYEVAHAKIRWLETRVDGLVNQEAQLQSEVKTLQQERTELQQTVSKLKDLLSSLGINSPCPEQENLTKSNSQ